MTDLPITPRENWLRLLRGETPLWTPMFSDTTLILPRIIPDNIARAMVIEADPVPEAEGGGPDMFGIPWVYVPTVHGSMEDPNEPHILDDISEWREKVKFPDMDAWDWEGAAERNKSFIDRSKYVATWFFTGMFERLISFMGFEEAAMTLIDDDCEDDLNGLCSALADNAIEFLRRMKKWFDIDGVFYHDDWGSQRAPFFSVSTAGEKLAPHIRRIVDFCHENGMYFEFHCCGKNEPLVPAMVEMGIDMWNGQQMNDKKMLYETYGDKFAIGESLLWGQDSTVEGVKQQIDEIIEYVAPECLTKRMYFQELFMGPGVPAEELKDYIRQRTMEMYANAKKAAE